VRNIVLISASRRARILRLAIAAGALWMTAISGNAFAQNSACPFNAAFPSGTTAATAPVDGLLLHRYSASQRESALTQRVRTNTNLSGAEAHIAKNLLRLDVDGDGEFNRNDALIISRFLAGFSSDAMVKDVPIIAAATRKTGSAIRDYINQGCPAAAPADAVQAKALAMWRKVQVKGSCSGCHGADFFDLARIGSSDATIARRATNDGATPQEAQDLVDAVTALRARFQMPTTDPLTFRPFQPGGQVLAGARPIDRDISFGRTLPTLLPVTMTPRTDGTPSVNSLATAKSALNELMAIDLRSMKMGVAYPRWSADIFNGAEHGTLNDWVADLAREPANAADREIWHSLQDAYLRNPTDANFWSMFAAVEKYTGNFTPVAAPIFTQLTPPKTGFSVNYFTEHKFKSALIGQHLLRTQLAGSTTTLQGKMGLSHLETGSLRNLFKFMEFLPGADMWEVGDTTRSVLGQQISNDADTAKNRLRALGFPQFVVDSQRADINWLDAEDELRLPWFWIGFTIEPTLKRINGSNSTKVGEYMHETLKNTRMFIHDAFSQAYRIGAQGTLAATPGQSIVYAPDYGYFMAYGAEIVNWNEDPRIGAVYEQSVKDEQVAMWHQFIANNFRMNMYLYREALQNGTARNANGTLRPANMPLCAAKNHFDRYQPAYRAHDYALIAGLAADMGVTLTCTL
jgi:mono/diheme cytochrome c family protein